MSEPERWTDEWIIKLWVDCPTPEGSENPDDQVTSFARAVAEEAMEEAAAEADGYGCETHCRCGDKHHCECGNDIAGNVRARAKEISGER